MNLIFALLLLSSFTLSCDSLVPSAIRRHKRSNNNSDFQHQPQRREILRSAAVGGGLTLINYLALQLVLDTQTAHAVKHSNEALCGTGFFTNIAQYYCTEIGDISDEGKSRKLSVEETSSLDSLMNKLDLNDSRSSSSSSPSSYSSEGSGGNETGNRNDNQGSGGK